MPFSIQQLRNKNSFKIFNPKTEIIHSYHTSKEIAVRQVRLMNRLVRDYNFTFPSEIVAK